MSSASTESKLFKPVTIGAWQLRNHIAMAPLTRCRAAPDTLSPQPMNVIYYLQRASAGLIITEATQISQQGQGYAGTPGIYSDAQVEGWKKITEAVHGANGKIIIQLWHVGRISHPSMQPGGGLPVAPSAVKPNIHAHTPTGPQEIPSPRALELSEIPGIVTDYIHAAEQAKKAGFDGIEIHSANGYLLDQFLRDSTNFRSDAYGGSVENRARLALEVTDAMMKIWPRNRIGIRLSPVSNANDIKDSNPQAIFGYLIEQLDKRGLAYIHMIEGNTGGTRDVPGFDYGWARRRFSGAYIANNSFTRELAIAAVEEGKADLIAFGRPFIGNPDLVERLQQNAPLTKPNAKLFYASGTEGYIDYPKLAA